MRRGKGKVGRRCPLNGTCQNVGTIRMWGHVTRSYIICVCKEHEQVYHDYGWIRVRLRKVTK